MEFLVFPIVFAIIVGMVASSKGRSGFGWSVYGFFLGVIALVHVLLIGGGNTKKCPKCLSKIPDAASICAFCRHKFA